MLPQGLCTSLQQRLPADMQKEEAWKVQQALCQACQLASTTASTKSGRTCGYAICCAGTTAQEARAFLSAA